MIGGQPVCRLATVCLVLCIEDISVWGEWMYQVIWSMFRRWNFVPHYHIQIVSQSYFTEGQYNSENTESHCTNNCMGFHYLLLHLNMGTEIVFIPFVFVSRD